MPEYTDGQREQYQKLYDELLDCMKNSPQDFGAKLKDALTQGFQIDFQDDKGWTLLMKSMGYERSVKAGIPEILLDYEADPNIAILTGDRPLDWAIYQSRSLKLIGRLIYEGADVNARNKQGITAFYWAAWNYIYVDDKAVRDYGLSMAQFLLKHGADPYLYSDWLWLQEGADEKLSVRCKEFDSWIKKHIRRKEFEREAAYRDAEAFMR